MSWKGSTMRDARILVVDDEVEVLDLLRNFLEEEGYEVVTTSSAMEAESLLTSHGIDLAMLDVGVHGLRLGQRAVELDKPFILMSGSPLVVEMGELGSVLRKPFKLAELRRVVARRVGRATQRPTAAEVAGAAGYAG